MGTPLPLQRWREKNRDTVAVIQRRYYARHAEEIRERDRARRGGKERVHRAAYMKRWASRNREHLNAYMKQWLSVPENREKMRGYCAQSGNKRRVAKIANGGSHTRQEWEDLVRSYGGRCAYCGRDDRRLSRDHIVPLSKGGRDDIANIVPACRPCNSRKGTRPIDFMYAGGGERQ